EDGIRDRNVTGVQTCALPISIYHHWQYLDSNRSQLFSHPKPFIGWRYHWLGTDSKVYVRNKARINHYFTEPPIIFRSLVLSSYILLQWTAWIICHFFSY